MPGHRDEAKAVWNDKGCKKGSAAIEKGWVDINGKGEPFSAAGLAQLFREQAGEPPDKLDLKEVGEFLAGVLSLWQLIRQMAAGGDVGYLCTEKIFQDFFELGPGDGAPAGSDPASPFSTAPAVGTDFGDWRVSGGVLLVQALPVPDGQ